MKKRTHNVVLDRIEGKLAVVLDGVHPVEIPCEWIPEGVREGDQLIVVVDVDENETKERRQTLEEKLNRLKKSSSLPRDLDL